MKLEDFAQAAQLELRITKGPKPDRAWFAHLHEPVEGGELMISSFGGNSFTSFCEDRKTPGAALSALAEQISGKVLGMPGSEKIYHVPALEA